MDEHASAIDTAAAIRTKEVSPLEVLEATLARVDARNPELNAVIWRNDDEARAEARALGERIAAGDDRPPAVRRGPAPDQGPAARGRPARHLRFARARPTDPPSDSELVATAFVDAGFILCGRTNTPEFGSITVTENTRFGATRNPWDTGVHARVARAAAPAAAVASGMFPAANASDGGGSIRIPASCCGLVGHKPSRGRVADTVPGWSGLSTEGVRHPHGGRRGRHPRRDQRPRPVGLVEPAGQGAPVRRGGRRRSRAAPDRRQHRLRPGRRGGAGGRWPPSTTPPRCSSPSATTSSASTPTCSTRRTSGTSST